MSSASILLGAVLTFGTSDGRTLQLTVSTTKAATCALAWGDLASRSETVAKTRHVFRDLPVPSEAALTYVLGVGGEAPRRVSVGPIARDGVARIAVYGDSRDGSAPHQRIVQAIAALGVDVVVHTGDVVHSADDTEGWVKHLAASLPLTARVPVVLSLGNHELYDTGTAGAIDPLAKAMAEIPPPVDPIAREVGAPIAAFHVRVGPALFVSLDSNSSLARGSPQFTFLERVLSLRGDARFVFVSYHHGPLSSGPHGGHPLGPDLISLFEAHRVTASLAGHDHLYERIVRNGVTYLVSGGGGAPLYAKSRRVAGSQAFASTYNWVSLIADGPRDTVSLEAYSLEGVVLDRASVWPAPPVEPPVSEVVESRFFVFAALLISAGAFAYACFRILLHRRVV